jgi:hypothetical protein
MSNKSIHYTTGAVQLVNPAARIAATSGQIDKNNSGAPFEALELIRTTGGWTDGQHTFVIQEADDDGTGNPSTYAAVASTDLIPSTGFASITGTTGQSTVARVAYVGAKRWVRVTSTVAGTTTGLIWGLIAVTGHYRNKPSVASGT